MSLDHTQPRTLEIAHVLFMDIVGYSRLPMDQQTQLLQQLNQIIRSTEEFRRAQAGDQLIRLPTGDGMALVFFGNPVAPVQCAMEVSCALRNQQAIKLRMGVHSGPVYQVADINTNKNVAGGGINIAQRVMDCGDAGHILLSRTVVEVLSQLSSWEERLHDLGEAEIKHGERVHVFNLYTSEVGNPEVPEKLRSQLAPPAGPESEGASTFAAVDAEVVSTTMRVALLYKRHAQPDEHVLQLLEKGFRARGYKVFIDRHLAIGVEWAKEIERQLRTADAVIPLLSAASVTSEMLAYEVQIAHEAAQQQNGRPRLLPVRINFEGLLPDPLGGILAPLQYALWSGSPDDQKLTAELLTSLVRPSAPKPKAAPHVEPPGGAVPLDSRFYIVRPTDGQFLDAIKRRDSIVLVKGARQMGKTSLLARGLQQARLAGSKVVVTDFQKLNSANLESIEALFLTLGELIADQLGLDVLPDEVWKARRAPSINFERYLRREVMDKLQAPLVWGLDEVDRLFTCPYASEIFGLFRTWHNERAVDPAAPWGRLTLAIVYATEAHLFITDQNQSPFNVGTRLELRDFTFDQVAELNQRYGAPLHTPAEVARYFRLVSGHPYLVRRGLHEMATNSIDLGIFEDQADRDEGPFGDHLRRILVLLARDPALCDIVRGVLRGEPCPTMESFYRLRSAGVMCGDSAREVKPRCQLYANYLERHLL